ncbi:ENTS family enterobactin (siderophore) exporter [Bradyrhizobium sp. LB12.1]|uniref:MFS transporter n=1 Tax=Bradyrhizobium sp. LB12.1 TaxID=3156327 RepID=UPI0033970708
MKRLLVNVFAIDVARGMARVTLSWAMLQGYGAYGVSAVVLLISVGQFLGALGAGHLTDRFSRAKLAREASWIGGIGFLSIGIAFATRQEGVFVIGALAFVTYVLLAVHDNAIRTLIPSIVSSHEIERANGHFITAGEIGSFCGPAVAGWLVAAYGAQAVILLAAASCLIAAATIRRLKVQTERIALPGERNGSDLKYLNVGFFKANSWLGFGLVLAVLANILVVPISLVLVPIRIKEVGFGAMELGYFYAALSMGFAASGVFWTQKLWTRIGDLRLAAFLAAGSMVYLLTSYFNLMPLILICGAAAGFFLAKFEISWNSLLQTRIDSGLLGRVYGLGSWTSFGGRTLGVAAVGSVTSLIGVQATTFGLIVCLLLAVLIVVALGQVKSAQME